MDAQKNIIPVNLTRSEIHFLTKHLHNILISANQPLMFDEIQHGYISNPHLRLWWSDVDAIKSLINQLNYDLHEPI